MNNKLQTTNDQRRTKKAELSINVIVMAVVALLVLVVLTILLLRYFSKGDTQLGQCQQYGGLCEGSAPKCSQDGWMKYSIGDKECGDNQMCCISKDAILGS
jgi:hypothetical protein